MYAKALQKPKFLQCDTQTLSKTYGKFIAEPFERGFGITLGNSLRRVLLSSIPGSAITAVKIEGVLHEFSTIPDVKEDVTDIILNIKKIKLKLKVPYPITLKLNKTGPGVIKAGDIEPNINVEILNPEQHIATLDKKGKIEMEMIVKWGRGFVPAEKNIEESLPIGWIPIDAIFSPIIKVNFTVEDARVGFESNYDRLILEIYTDGSISPEEALVEAAKILRDQLLLFTKEEFEPIEREKEEVVDDQWQKIRDYLLRSVDELELSVRAQHCLENADIRIIAELVQKTEQDLLKTKNFGRKSLNELKQVLANLGLHLNMDITPYKITKEDIEKARKQAISQSSQ